MLVKPVQLVFQMLERVVRLVGTDPIINESEFSGVGSSADVATHMSSLLALTSTSTENRGTTASAPPSR